MPCGKGISRSKTKKPSPLGGRWPKTVAQDVEEDDTIKIGEYEFDYLY